MHPRSNEIIKAAAYLAGLTEPYRVITCKDRNPDKAVVEARMLLAGYVRHYMGGAYSTVSIILGRVGSSYSVAGWAIRRFDALPIEEQLDKLDAISNEINRNRAALAAVTEPGVPGVPRAGAAERGGPRIQTSGNDYRGKPMGKRLSGRIGCGACDGPAPQPASTRPRQSLKTTPGHPRIGRSHAE